MEGERPLHAEREVGNGPYRRIVGQVLDSGVEREGRTAGSSGRL